MELHKRNIFMRVQGAFALLCLSAAAFSQPAVKQLHGSWTGRFSFDFNLMKPKPKPAQQQQFAEQIKRVLVTLVLREDSTYDFGLTGGAKLHQTSSGTWKLQKDSIVFTDLTRDGKKLKKAVSNLYKLSHVEAKKLRLTSADGKGISINLEKK